MIDRYHILEQLGQGGMATVYLAHDPRLDRKVAVKVIRQDAFPPAILDKILKRFDLEAKALARLNHPNIVGVIDYGVYNDAPYLVMQFIPSGTLKEKINHPVHYSDAAQILAPIAKALAYAHEEKIIHRDVKPSNILITRSGEPVLTDFGIAKIFEEAEGNTLTSTGMGLGTPEYMAPEQWQGKACASSDQYALGVIFYEMITGQKPYIADTPPAVMLKQATEPFPKPSQYVSDLPEQVEFVSLKLLAKDPQNRYDSMRVLAKVLERFAQESHKISAAEEKSKLETLPIPDDQIDVITKYDLVNDKTSDLLGNIEDKLGSPVRPDQKISTTTDQISVEEELKSIENNEDLLGHVTRKELMQENDLLEHDKAFDHSSHNNDHKKILAIVIFGFIIVLFIMLLFFVLNFPNISSKSIVESKATETISLYLFSTKTYQPTATPTTTITVTITQTPFPSASPLPTLGIESTLISEIDGMEMVYVPAGSFLMGTDSIEAYIIDEKPEHEVYLDAYWIDKFEVSNAQYALCVAAGDCVAPADSSSYNRGSYYDNSAYDDYPVIHVNWFDALAYCKWAERDLPTEAQWEKAARGTDGLIYPWGNEIPNKNLANFRASNTTATGSFPLGSSPYGVMDMAGNVWEWVNDWHGEDYYSLSPDQNPNGPTIGEYKVLRGGSWNYYDGGALRSFVRHYSNPDNSHYLYGFRCATSP